jgi:hypothetical protein
VSEVVLSVVSVDEGRVAPLSRKTTPRAAPDRARDSLRISRSENNQAGQLPVPVLSSSLLAAGAIPLSTTWCTRMRVIIGCVLIGRLS